MQALTKHQLGIKHYKEGKEDTILITHFFFLTKLLKNSNSHYFHFSPIWIPPKYTPETVPTKVTNAFQPTQPVIPFSPS